MRPSIDAERRVFSFGAIFDGGLYWNEIDLK